MGFLLGTEGLAGTKFALFFCFVGVGTIFTPPTRLLTLVEASYPYTPKLRPNLLQLDQLSALSLHAAAVANPATANRHITPLQRMPHEHLALVTRETAFLGLMGLKQLER